MATRIAYTFGLFASFWLLTVRYALRSVLSFLRLTPRAAKHMTTTDRVEKRTTLVALHVHLVVLRRSQKQPLPRLSLAKNKRTSSLITDSLWGNLILEMAYQRDPEIKKIAKRLNLVNFGTMTAITGVAAGGTLAQGIIALSVLILRRRFLTVIFLELSE